MTYDDYNDASTTHGATLDEVKRYLLQAGIVGGTADWAALRTIKRHIDTEAIAAAFRDSFLMISVSFLIASLPLIWIAARRYGSAPQSPAHA